MKERPIIFSADSVRAILAGRKTQTRRLLGGKPPSCPDHGESCPDLSLEVMAWGGWTDGWTGYRKCPYGVPGDRLWVRETFSPCACSGCLKAWPKDSGLDHGVIYREEYLGPSGVVFSPSIFMPRWASRLLLRVEAVRVERVQEITPADCMAEGIGHMYGYDETTRGLPADARERFAETWNEINGKRAPWASNPWVWAVTFTREQP